MSSIHQHSVLYADSEDFEVLLKILKLFAHMMVFLNRIHTNERWFPKRDHHLLEQDNVMKKAQ